MANSLIKSYKENDILYFNFKGRKPIKLLAISDVHYDSKYCDRNLLKHHLDTALNDNAYIIINGDWFDSMGSMRDPRSKPNMIREEYYQKGVSYLDAIVKDSFEFLKKYQHRILWMSFGNHETSMMQHHDTNILERLVYMLNINQEHQILLGQYDGVSIYQAKDGGTYHHIMYNHHGSMGGRRSKGSLMVDIRKGVYPFADLIVSGHTHEKWHMPSLVYDYSHQTKTVKTRKQHHIVLGHYKDTSDKRMGWAKQREFNPTATGGYWIEMHLTRDRIDGVQQAHEKKYKTEYRPKN